jgi:hypothetical protein
MHMLRLAAAQTCTGPRLRGPRRLSRRSRCRQPEPRLLPLAPRWARPHARTAADSAGQCRRARRPTGQARGCGRGAPSSATNVVLPMLNTSVAMCAPLAVVA